MNPSISSDEFKALVKDLSASRLTRQSALKILKAFEEVPHLAFERLQLTAAVEKARTSYEVERNRNIRQAAYALALAFIYTANGPIL